MPLFEVSAVNGYQIMTDKGGVELIPWDGHDGEPAMPVTGDDWIAMRDAFVSLPKLQQSYDDLSASYINRAKELHDVRELLKRVIKELDTLPKWLMSYALAEYWSTVDEANAIEEALRKGLAPVVAIAKGES